MTNMYKLSIIELSNYQTIINYQIFKTYLRTCSIVLSNSEGYGARILIIREAPEQQINYTSGTLSTPPS